MVTSSCKRKGAADETYLSQKSSNFCSTSKAHLVTCTFKINCQVQCLGQPRHNFCLIQYLFSMGTLVWAESLWSADPSSNVLSKMIIQDKGLVFISLTKNETAHRQQMHHFFFLLDFRFLFGTPHYFIYPFLPDHTGWVSLFTVCNSDLWVQFMQIGH